MRKIKNYIRKIQYSFKKNKRRATPYLILVFVLSLSIAYSAFGTKLNIGSFIADVRLKKDVRITGVSVASETEGGGSGNAICTLENDMEPTGLSYGDEYSCDPGDGVTRTFYLLEDGDNTSLVKGTTGTAGPGEVSLIMNENIGDAISWGGNSDETPTVALPYLQSLTSEWNVEVSMPTYEQIYAVNNSTDLTNSQWLVANLDGIYWLSTVEVHIYTSVYGVLSNDEVKRITIDLIPVEEYYVRPVITIPKSQLNVGNSGNVIQNNGGSTTYTDYNINNISTGVNLPNEDSSVTLNIEITNLESAEVGILDITGLPDNLDYDLIDYDLGEKICDSKGKCNLGITKNIKMTIKYIDGEYDSTKTFYDVVANFDFQQFYSVKYTDIKIPGCTIERQVAGKYTVGDVVTCGEEQFYVIENQDTDATEGIDMLAMYNLTLTESPIQDTTGATNPIAFSSSNYWYDTTNKVFTVDANYASEGRSYPYVYRSYIVDGEEQNNMYPYVDAYRDMLEGMQVNIIDAKLMSYEQIIEFGCEELEYCTSAYSWLYSTSYWTGSSVGPGFEEAVWPMFSGGYFHDSTFNDDEWFGIRPVITIRASEIEEFTLPKEVLGGSTFIVDFGDSAPSNIIVKVGDMETTDYAYENGVLTVNNITGDVEIIKEETPDSGSTQVSRYYSWSSGNIGGDLPSDAKPTVAELNPSYPFYLGLDVDSNNKVTAAYACFVRNETQYCLKGADTEAYETNKAVLEDAFKDVENACSVVGDGSGCNADGLSAYATSYGNAAANDDYASCGVSGNGSFDCFEY